MLKKSISLNVIVLVMGFVLLGCVNSVTQKKKEIINKNNMTILVSPIGSFDEVYLIEINKEKGIKITSGKGAVNFDKTFIFENQSISKIKLSKSKLCDLIEMAKKLNSFDSRSRFVPKGGWSITYWGYDVTIFSYYNNTMPTDFKTFFESIIKLTPDKIDLHSFS